MAQFKGMLHLLHKRMANVSYPISKQEILEQIGSMKKKGWVCNIITGNKRQMLNTKGIYRCGKIRILERKRLRWKKQD